MSTQTCVNVQMCFLHIPFLPVISKAMFFQVLISTPCNRTPVIRVIIDESRKCYHWLTFDLVPDIFFSLMLFRGEFIHGYYRSVSLQVHCTHVPGTL
jgi:hypothetical protein